MSRRDAKLSEGVFMRVVSDARIWLSVETDRSEGVP